jgi:hypothetical protein
MERIKRNPWKIATVTIVAALSGALISGLVVAKVQSARSERNVAVEEAVEVEEEVVAEVEPTPEPAPTQTATTQSAPGQVPLEDCERYRWATKRDKGHIVRDGILGAAVGAGLGAATGAIVDGGNGAGKGAGVGAVVGVAGGSLYGLNQENRKTEQARQAYYACMARRG